MSRITATKHDGTPERQLVIGAIVSSQFLRQFRFLYHPGLVESRAVEQILGWCMMYWDRYEKAPGKTIQDMYQSAIRTNKIPDEEQGELIADLLEQASEEYQSGHDFNAPYHLDKAQHYLTSRRAKQLSEDIEAELTQGNDTEAEALISRYKKVELGTAHGTNPYTDTEKIFTAFERTAEPLMRFPGALGHMLDKMLVRDGFIGIMGPEKRGKTFWLMEIARAAMRSRCNTAFFEVGDMSEDQMIMRFLVSAAGKNYDDDYCGNIWIPVLDCVHNQSDECRLKCRIGTMALGVDIDSPEEVWSPRDAPKGYEPCAVCHDDRSLRRNYRGSYWYKRRSPVEPLTWREGLRAGKKFFKRMTGRDFKLYTCPNSSISVAGIESQLDIWEAGCGFVPDVVIVDYADILLPNDPKLEFRHQENDKWKALRRLSQKRHCLVVTATQADAASYDAKILKAKHFSEDKRKYAHVTGMLGLNQTDVEKVRGLMRLNWIMLREGKFSVTRSVTVLQCLEIGRPVLGSFY